jgi:hypothetical protein
MTFHINMDTGHEHMHVVWSRIDVETMSAVPLPFFKIRLKEVARELEKALGLTVVKNERDGSVQAPKRNEFEQARRLGVDIKHVRQTIRDCWEHSDNGVSFRAALADQNLTLAQGDRRDFVVLDQEGGLHALGKRILGVTAAQTRSRLSDLNRNEMPSIAQVRQLIAEQQRHPQDRVMPDPDLREMAWQDALAKAAIEKEKIERQFVELKREKEKLGGKEKESTVWEETAYETRGKFRDSGVETAGTTSPNKPLQGVEKQVWNSYRSGTEPGDFSASLDSRGIAFARVTRDEADRSHREAQFAKAVGRIAPVYQENEIVVVRSAGLEHLRQGEWTEPNRVRKMDQTRAQKYLQELGLDTAKLKGIDETKEILNVRATERSAAWDRIRLEQGPRSNRVAPEKGRNPKGAALGKQAGRAFGKTLDAVSNAIESFFAPIATPEEKREGERETRRRQIDASERMDLSSELARLAEERQRRKQEGQQTQRSHIDERDR